jgi:hypothetical protein
VKIEHGLSPNCSEAVFRFYTEDSKVAHRILQAFADEVAEANGHKAEIVPEFQDMEKVKQVSFGACAGMGEPVTKCIWEPKHKAFVLCIGNNDISADGKGCKTVRELGIKVEEAEICTDLQKYARDCTCGNVFFQDLAPLQKGEPST